MGRIVSVNRGLAQQRFVWNHASSPLCLSLEPLSSRTHLAQAQQTLCVSVDLVNVIAERLDEWAIAYWRSLHA